MKRKISLLLPLLLIPSFLWANDEPPEEPPWYEFELIIYANHGAAQSSDELWNNNPGQPNRLNTLPLLYKTVAEREAEAHFLEMSQQPEPQGQSIDKLTLEPSEIAQEGELEEAATMPSKAELEEPFELPVAYQQLPDESLQLGEIYHKLVATNGRIEPLVHMAWRQQVEPPESAKTLYLVLPTNEAAQTPGLPDQSELPQLEGSIKISVKRYLHIDIDMVLRRLATPPATDEGTLTTLGPHYQAYRMQMRRRMRSKELHYLDHPIMGVLIIARRYEIPQPIDELEALPDDTLPIEITE